MSRKEVCMNTQVQFNTSALIPIHINESESEQITISARELHDYLEVDTDYPHWFQRMTEYGFTENSDFRTFLTESTGGRPATDAQITIDMAKQICMLQRSAKGSQARQYFIQLEKDWNTPEKVMARALQIANKQIASLGTQIESMKPKALFADAVSSSHTSILIGDLAKILKGNGISIGQKRLFEDLRSDGYLIKSGSSKNMPTQRSMELGLMEIKEGSYINGDGQNITTRTTKVTGKGQIYFVNRYLNRQNGGDPDAAN